jgi:CubicO group peptidase (beta-lactamase class C family)
MSPVPGWSKWGTGALLAVWLLAAQGLGPSETPETTPAPGPVDPSSVSFDAAIEAGEALPRLHSLLVSWQDKLVVEQYFHGARQGRRFNIKSASKSVISALVGIAIERGLIDGVDATIGFYFERLLDGEDNAPKRDITIEDLLTMRAGLETTSNRNYGRWVQSANWVRFALNQPLHNPPGWRMTYSTGNTHLLSAILTRSSGKSTLEFAREALAEPLGIDLAAWPQDPQGIYFGGNDMVMTPRQMLAFGELYLHHGRANGRLVVPETWIETSWVPRTRSHFSHRLYGYGWWIRELAGRRVNYAWGFGGQFIFVVPEIEMVVVTTSSDAPGRDRRGYLGAVYDLVENHVIAPAAAAMGLYVPGNGQWAGLVEEEMP